MPERVTICNTSPLLYLHIVGTVGTVARRIARLNRLRFTGTMGVILRAKQRGLLDAVQPVVLALRNAGLWLSDSLVTQVLRQAGEL